MADRYDARPHRPLRRRTLAGLLTDVVLIVLTVAVSVLLLAAYLSPWVHPAHLWVFSFLGLGVQILYLAEVCLLLLWIVRWRWRMALPVAMVLLLGVGYIPRFWQPQWLRHEATEEPTADEWRVMSYNVRNFTYPPAERAGGSTLRLVGALVDSVAPDVLCMQEWQSTVAAPAETFEEACARCGFQRRVGFRYRNTDGEHGVGNAIYSRYPIVRWGAVDNRQPGDSTPVMAVWADIARAADTLRVVNVHLRTTSISASDHEYIVRGGFFDDDEANREVKLRRLGRRFRDNVRIRAAQADTLARLVARSPYPVIVTGDFNDSPMSYAYRRLGGGLRDAFRDKGRGAVYTYRGFFDLFRIDFIFADPRFEIRSYDRLRYPYSDHYPVVVRLHRKMKP